MNGFGFSLGFRFLAPRAESWRGYWYVQAFGLCVFRDTLPPETAGQRGVW